MSSVVHSVLGAALLLTGASAAMAQSATAPVANQPVQAGVAAAPVAYQQVQPAAPAPAPVAAQPQKPTPVVADNADRYGGHDPNSTAGTRAFWEALNPY